MASAEARRKVGVANARRYHEAAEWERTHEKPEPEAFTHEILPLLQNATLTQMKRATGLLMDGIGHSGERTSGTGA